MNSNQLGLRLVQLRTEAGLTQRALAVRADVPIVTISELERGLNDNPKLKTLAALAGALGCTVADLLDEPANGPKVAAG